LWQRHKDLAQLKIKVIVITFEPQGPTAFRAMPTDAVFPYYVDEDRRLYRYYGMLRAGFWDLWGLGTWLVYLRLLAKGRKLLPSESDIHQRGGDVLIDPSGTIRYHHIGSGPADRPDPEIICRLVGND
jgi:hypothetical protein